MQIMGKVTGTLITLNHNLPVFNYIYLNVSFLLDLEQHLELFVVQFKKDTENKD